MKIKCKCDNCGKDIEKKNDEFIKSKNHFCTINCYRFWQSPRAKILKCDFCKKDIYVDYTQLKNQNHHFCNKICWGNWQSENKKGCNSNTWRGGKRKSSGYIEIYMPEHPYCNSHGYVKEHRLVMEEQIGRYLTKYEIIHHLNGVKSDNRPENLYLTDCHKHEKKTSIRKYINRVIQLEYQLTHIYGCPN